jgi:hypothetical protein
MCQDSRTVTSNTPLGKSEWVRNSAGWRAWQQVKFMPQLLGCRCNVSNQVTQLSVHQAPHMRN